jgi:PAS domain S-box-containing protein
MKRSSALATTVLVGTAYFVAAEIAQVGLRVSGEMPMLWIASAVAIAGLLLRGPVAFIGILLGAFACLLFDGHGIAGALGKAGLATAQTGLAWWVMVRVLRIDPALERIPDMLGLATAGAALCPLLGALSTLLIAWMQGRPDLADYGETVQVIALGEAVGTLLLLPAILTWAAPTHAGSPQPGPAEPLVAYALALLVSVTVFSGIASPAMSADSLPYALFPLTFWAALRLGVRTTASMLLVVGTVAVAFHSQGMGPFVHARIGPTSPMAHFASLYLFLAVLSITSMLAAVAQRERSFAESRVQESEQQYRTLIEGMNEGVNITDAEARMVFVSDRFCEMLGYARDDLLGRTGEALIVPEQHAEWEESHRLRRAGKARPHGLVLRRKDGDLLHVWVSPRPRFDASGRYVGSLNVVLDVTDRRRAEDRARQHLDQLAHVARVASMGEMASAIAHEINQPLTAIANYASASLRLMKAGKLGQEDAVDALQRLAAEAERAGEIVRKMRGFVRGEEGHPEPIPVRTIFADVVRLSGAEARQHEVELVVDVPSDTPVVRVDAIQIQQVLLNLVRNAIEAMVAAGSTERRVTLCAGHATDAMVQLTVRDTGPGLPAAEPERVFEPFFTTKPDGIGIGLALSRSIVDAHGGRLWAEPGNPGAVFHLTLAIAAEIVDADT